MLLKVNPSLKSKTLYFEVTKLNGVLKKSLFILWIAYSAVITLSWYKNIIKFGFIILMIMFFTDKNKMNTLNKFRYKLISFI